MKKLLSLFLASVVFTAIMGYTLLQEQESMAAPENTYPAAEEKITPLNVRFSAKNESELYNQIDYNREDVLKNALKSLPTEHVSELKRVVIDYDPSAHRGYGGKEVIILRGVKMNEAEMVGVLIHELGHVVDLGWLAETDQITQSGFIDFNVPVYESDPSLDFYRISWDSDTQRKKTAQNDDFVSGYAMSNPFEEFAETYAYYVLHHYEFRKRASTNLALAQKYLYMKKVVFNGKTFATGNVRSITEKQPWDVTVLSYDSNKFLLN